MRSPRVRKVPGAFETPVSTPVSAVRVPRTTAWGSPIARKIEQPYEPTSLATAFSFVIAVFGCLFSLVAFVNSSNRLRHAKSFFHDLFASVLFVFRRLFASFPSAFRRGGDIADHNLHIDESAPPRFNLTVNGLQGTRLDFVLRAQRNSSPSHLLREDDPFTTVDNGAFADHLLQKALALGVAREASEQEMRYIETRFWRNYDPKATYTTKEKVRLQSLIEHDCTLMRIRGYLPDLRSERINFPLSSTSDDDEGYVSDCRRCYRKRCNHSLMKPNYRLLKDPHSLELSTLERQALAEKEAAEVAEAAEKAAKLAAAEAAKLQRKEANERAKKAKLEAERQAQEAKQIRRREIQSQLIKMPSDDHINKMNTAMTQPSKDTLASPGGNILTSHSLNKLLNPTGWLDDIVIMSYLRIVTDLANARAGKTGKGVIPKVIALESFLYNDWLTADKERRDLASVPNGLARRYGIKPSVKLLEVETIFIPVNLNAHWTLLVISPKQRKIEYIDSYRSSGRQYIANARKFLAGFLGTDYKEKEWQEVQTVCPRQTNGYDCGVFVSTNAECIAGGVSIDCYKEKDLQTQRRRMAAVLLNEGFGNGLVPAMELQ